MSNDEFGCERWLPVVDWEGLYKVSDHGRVRSIDRIITQISCQGRPCQRLLSGRILKQAHTGSRGYWSVHLSNCKRHKMVNVHHLVLEAFVSPRPVGMKALHWDDNLDNNCLNNLRWGTLSDNHADALRNGGVPSEISRDALGRYTWEGR
jgi:hypothetical protein